MLSCYFLHSIAYHENMILIGFMEYKRADISIFVEQKTHIPNKTKIPELHTLHWRDVFWMYWNRIDFANQTNILIKNTEKIFLEWSQSNGIMLDGLVLEGFEREEIPGCSGLCFCFFFFFSFFFFLRSLSSSCLFCFLCFLS